VVLVPLLVLTSHIQLRSTSRTRVSTIADKPTPYVVTSRNVEQHVVHYVCSLMYYCFPLLFNALIWFPLLIQIELHHVEVEAMSQLTLMDRGICVADAEHHTSFTKVRDEVRAILHALT
jgi:hypothetical protein